MLFPLPVSADMGPKASITVRVTNLPDQEVYLDLLIEQPPFLNEEGFRYGRYEWGEDPEYYDQKMLGVLKSYNVDGWRTALVTGTWQPLWGELRLSIEDGAATSNFGYFGVPDRFKIIAVTESGDVVVSNVIDKKMFESVVDFDFVTGAAKEKSPVALIVRQFAITLPITLAIEALILLAFRFSLRQNWKPFLIINICTQAALHAGIYFSTSLLGMFGGLFAYVGIEFLIFIAEAVLFAFLLKQHSKLRRVLYSISANAASFVIGIVLLIFFAVV